MTARCITPLILSDSIALSSIRLVPATHARDFLPWSITIGLTETLVSAKLSLREIPVRVMSRFLKVMQILILLLLPVLAAGTSFEVCKGREVALFHDDQQHMTCCGHHEGQVIPGADSCHCSHHHHHEQIRLLMDIGERPVRLYVAAVSAIQPTAPLCLPPVELRKFCVMAATPPGRKLSPTGCHLLPLIC